MEESTGGIVATSARGSQVTTRNAQGAQMKTRFMNSTPKIHRQPDTEILYVVETGNEDPLTDEHIIVLKGEIDVYLYMYVWQRCGSHYV